MASAGATVGGGLFNALAFSAASFMFSKMDHSGYTEEAKRHNLAMEKMTEDRDRWNKEREEELDRISKLHHDQFEDEKDLKEGNRAFYRVHSKFESKAYSDTVKKFNSTKPKLSDYYKPSEEMKEYLTFVKFLGTIPVLYGVFALVV